MVFVLNKNKKPLSPCSNAKARKLLSKGKAIVHKRFPFTIRLRTLKNNEGIHSNKEYRLKIDYGSRYTGLSILSDDKVLWLAELQHRINIKSKLNTRKIHRRFRRKKLRYRKPRFLNRKIKKGWVAPSLNSRVNNIHSWVNKIQKLIPLTHISYENCKFDTQLINNPNISGIEYQQGTLKGYEIREYLLEKFNRQCIYCGIKNVPLEIEHLIPKSRGGSNKIDNLGIACRNCNQNKGSKTSKEFGYIDIQNNIKSSLRDSALINATRWKIYNSLVLTGLEVECGTGARTKMNRIKLDLPKTHYYDSCCIGKTTPDSLVFMTNKVLLIKAIGRGSYFRTNVDKYGFPRSYLPRRKYFFGFMSGDIVKAIVTKGVNLGTWEGSGSCRSRGNFNINLNGSRIQGINHKYCTIVQKSDGYKYTLDNIK